jgi:hypothetical protein
MSEAYWLIAPNGTYYRNPKHPTTMVKRYTDPGDESGRDTLYEDSKGDFVRFDDYERLRGLLREARNVVGLTLRDRIDAALGGDT